MKSSNYILINDYFSRFIEVIKLKSTISEAIIEALKSVFFLYGILEITMSDNGPQYSSNEFKVFAKKYNLAMLQVVRYSPQSNWASGACRANSKEIVETL